MNKTEQNICDKIIDHVLTECSIVCCKCGTIEKEYVTDEYFFTEKLVMKGWTYKKGNVLCDNCQRRKK